MDREAPPAVVGAVSAGTVPVALLAVYAVMFIVHGWFHPVVPPDVTSTAHGEGVVGIGALILFVVSVVVLLWMLNGVRRWPFVVFQLAVLGAAIDFVVDDTKGGRTLSAIVAVLALVAVVLSFAPAARDHVGRDRLALPLSRFVARRRGAPDVSH